MAALSQQGTSILTTLDSSGLGPWPKQFSGGRRRSWVWRLLTSHCMSLAGDTLSPTTPEECPGAAGERDLPHPPQPRGETARSRRAQRSLHTAPALLRSKRRQVLGWQVWLAEPSPGGPAHPVWSLCFRPSRAHSITPDCAACLA